MTNETESPTKELLARVDERTKSIQTDISKFRDDLKNSFISLSDRIKETETRHDIKYDENKKNIDELKELVDTHYIKKDEFEPVKKIVYGFVAFLLLSIGGMFIALLAKPSVYSEARTTITSSPGEIIKPGFVK
jgi:hypothetical protein